MVKRRKSNVALPPAECRLRECVSLIAGAWTADLIWFLRAGERCFSELESDLKGVSAKVLSSKLRRLEQQGILLRIPRQTSPPTVYYDLTPLGHDLLAALIQVMEVGQRLKAARVHAK